MKKLTSILFFVLICLSPLMAQDNQLAPVTRTIAITNVNIVPSPGQLIENGTVVVKDGVITAVGNNVKVPPGARIIKADSMYLYSGFILGMSHAGIKMPETKEQPKVRFPASPPDDVAGITPERGVLDYLSPEEKSVNELRGLGFAIAQTAPEGGMLPGTASLILLKGNQTDEMIIRPGTALYATLQGARRMYPSTVIGVMAKYRELYRQAEQAQKFQQMYASDPGGMVRPFYDRTLTAFYPVLDKQIPVAFKGPEVLDAQRIMALQRDLGFNLIITGLLEGWDIADQVKSSNSKVLFGLDLPEWKEAKNDTTKQKKDNTKQDTVSQEKKMLEARKAEFAKKYYGQMAIYEKAGIPFGFSSVDAKTKDIHGNILKMVEHGLSESAALAAFTTTPASMLGINKMAGTVENGKIANLVISNKPYFTKDAKVKYVLVEGDVFEYKLKDTTKADPAVIASALGAWSYSTQSPQGTVTGIIQIREQDGVLSGTITNSATNETSALNDVILAGNKLSFSFTISAGDTPLNVESVVTLKGDLFEGTVSVENETYPITGTKEPEK